MTPLPNNQFEVLVGPSRPIHEDGIDLKLRTRGGLPRPDVRVEYLRRGRKQLCAYRVGAEERVAFEERDPDVGKVDLLAGETRHAYVDIDVVAGRSTDLKKLNSDGYFASLDRGQSSLFPVIDLVPFVLHGLLRLARIGCNLPNQRRLSRISRLIRVTLIRLAPHQGQYQSQSHHPNTVPNQARAALAQHSGWRNGDD